MPYEIRKSGDQWEVVNKDTHKSKGKSATKEKAEAHMRALYAAESAGKGIARGLRS